MFRLVALFKIRPPLFPMFGIVPSAGLTSFRPTLFSKALFLSSHFLGISCPITSFLGGHSLRMVGPVPGLGSLSQRLSSLFFGPELRKFVVVWWARRRRRGGGAFGAVARATAALLDAFYVRH